MRSAQQIRKKIANFVGVYNYNLSLSIKNLYGKESLIDLSVDELKDLDDTITKILSTDDESYGEFLSGYTAYCYKKNYRSAMLPVRIFVYEKAQTAEMTSPERFIVSRFDVKGNEHSVDEHRKKCSSKHNGIQEYWRNHNPEAIAKKPEIEKKRGNKQDISFIWESALPSWSQVLAVLKYAWINLGSNDKANKISKNKVNAVQMRLDRAVYFLFKHLENIGCNKAVISFQFTARYLRLNFDDGTVRNLPFFDDNSSVFVIWLYKSLKDRCNNNDQHKVLVEIIFQQIIEYFDPNDSQEKRSSKSILESTFTLNQYKATCENLIKSRNEAIPGFEISMRSLDFWLSVQSACLLSQIKKQRFPLTDEDKNTALKLIPQLKMRHKEIILYFLKDSSLIKPEVLADNIPLVLQRYSAASIARHNIKHWKVFLSRAKEHHWLKKHGSVLQLAGNNTRKKVVTSPANRSQRKGRKKNRGESSPREQTKTLTGLLKVIEQYSQEEKTSSIYLNDKNLSNARRLEALNQKRQPPNMFEPNPVELIALFVYVCLKKNITDTLGMHVSVKGVLDLFYSEREEPLVSARFRTQLNEIVSCVKIINTQVQRIKNDGQYGKQHITLCFESSGVVYDLRKIKEYALNLYCCDQLARLDLNAPASVEEAEQLVKLILNDVVEYRQDKHDKQLFWGEMCRHFNAVAHRDEQKQPAVIVVERLIKNYHSICVNTNSELKRRILNQLKIAFCYALKYYYTGTTRLEVEDYFRKHNNLFMIQRMDYINEVSLKIIIIIIRSMDFSVDQHIHDSRFGRDVTMFTFLLQFLSEEPYSYEIIDETSFKRVKEMFEKLVFMGVEPGTCNRPFVNVDGINMSNELLECVKLYSYDLFDYFCQHNVSIEGNMNETSSNEADDLVRRFVTGKKTFSKFSMIPFIRFKIVFMLAKILECLFPDQKSAAGHIEIKALEFWKTNAKVKDTIQQILMHCLQLPEYHKFIKVMRDMNDNEAVKEASKYICKLENLFAILGTVESSVPPSAHDYGLQSTFCDRFADTIHYLDHVRFLRQLSMLDGSFSMINLNNDIYRLIRLLKFHYLFKYHIYKTEGVTVQRSKTEDNYINILRQKSINFNGFYINLGDGCSIPFVSFAILVNDVDLFTVLYENGADLTQRSSLGFLPADFVGNDILYKLLREDESFVVADVKTHPEISSVLQAEQKTPVAELCRYNKRRRRINEFLKKLGEVERKKIKGIRESYVITDNTMVFRVLFTNKLKAPNYYHLFTSFLSLAEKQSLKHNVVMFLMDWWVGCLTNMNRDKDEVPLDAIMLMRCIVAEYLFNPPDIKTLSHANCRLPKCREAQGLKVKFFLCLWRCLTLHAKKEFRHEAAADNEKPAVMVSGNMFCT